MPVLRSRFSPRGPQCRGKLPRFLALAGTVTWLSVTWYEVPRAGAVPFSAQALTSRSACCRMPVNSTRRAARAPVTGAKRPDVLQKPQVRGPDGAMSAPYTLRQRDERAHG
jgi:hypothetical protein